MPIIQTFLLEGRSEDQKAAFVAQATEAAVATLDVTREQVRVIISELPNTDYGIAGRTAKALGR